MRFSFFLTLVALAAALPVELNEDIEYKGPGKLIGELGHDVKKAEHGIEKGAKGLGHDLKKAGKGIEKGLGKKVGGTTVGGILEDVGIAALEGAILVVDENGEEKEVLIAEGRGAPI